MERGTATEQTAKGGREEEMKQGQRESEGGRGGKEKEKEEQTGDGEDKKKDRTVTKTKPNAETKTRTTSPWTDAPARSKENRDGKNGPWRARTLHLEVSSLALQPIEHRQRREECSFTWHVGERLTGAGVSNASHNPMKNLPQGKLRCAPVLFVYVCLFTTFFFHP
jgi:hypothetical protein